jgi:hypothetical protein
VNENFAADLETDPASLGPPESAQSQSPHEWTNTAARGLIVVVASLLAWYTWAHWGSAVNTRWLMP